MLSLRGRERRRLSLVGRAATGRPRVARRAIARARSAICRTALRELGRAGRRSQRRSPCAARPAAGPLRPQLRRDARLRDRARFRASRLRRKRVAGRVGLRRSGSSGSFCGARRRTERGTLGLGPRSRRDAARDRGRRRHARAARTSATGRSLPGARVARTASARHRNADVGLRGLDDPLVSRSEMEAWGACTTGGYRGIEFAGGHFFIHERQAEVAGVLGGAWAAA